MSKETLGDKFRFFTTKTYKEQGIAFLNAYWSEVQGDAENIWKWVNMFVELDNQNKAAGSDLDEFNAHRFLEKVQETKTVKELREQLKAIDLDFNKRMAMLEYCLFRYKKSVSDFVAKPQGDNSKALAEAERMLQAVQTALDNAVQKSEAAKRDAELSRQAAAEAKKQADAAAARAAEAKAAEDEQRAALADVQAQEDARNKKTEELKAKGEDQNLGVVARNKAKNELAQHLAEDPLPLRKAKITLEAATKKAARATAVAEEAKAVSDAAAAAAAKRAADAQASADAADAAVRETERQVEEAEAYLEKVKRESSGAGQGSIWFLQRELDEKKKYMPKSKGGSW